MMKKTVISLATAAALATAAQAATYEYPQLYKDPKVMGMGGANVALGGGFSSVFSNPAGLSKIPVEYGWEIEIINTTLSINENIMDFISDLDDATDVADTNHDGSTDDEENEAVNNVLSEYAGENNHLDWSYLLSLSKKFEKVGFGIGALGFTSLDMRTHQGFGADGLLEMNSLSGAGVIIGASYDYRSPVLKFGSKSIELNDFAVGVSAKMIQYTSVEASITAADVVANSDDLADYLEEEYKEEGTSTVLDLGLQYNLVPNLWGGKLIGGTSFLNIGGVGTDDAVEVPMTWNVGLGYLKRIEGKAFFNQFRVGLDYIDILKAYDQDESSMKRMRMGVDVNVWDGWLSTVALQAGLYQGYPSFGADVRIAMFKLAYANYAEEVGAYAGHDEDRRQMVNITFGW